MNQIYFFLKTKNSKKLQKLILILFFLFPNLSARANPLGLNQDDLVFCKTVRDNELKEAVSKNQTDKHGKFDTDFTMGFKKIIDVGGNSQGRWDDKSWKTNRDTYRRNYNSKDCDGLLQAAKEVTVAQINADLAKSVAQMQLEGSKYSEDTKRILGSIDLEKVKNTNSTNESIAKDTNATDLAKTKLQTQAGTLQTGIGAGAQVLTALINRPRQPKEPPQNVHAQQQQVIAVAPTDPADALLRQWGWAKVSCTPGVVFIKGLNTDTVCVNPTSAIPAGEYIYNSSTDQLQPVAIAPEPSIPEGDNSAATEEESETLEAEEIDAEQEEGEEEL